jgi:hypothetical protein
MLIAGIGHDVGHPGVGNAFLVQALASTNMFLVSLL